MPSKDERDYIDARIKDIETAASRSRWLFGFSIALSWLLIAMAYNSTWSYMRSMAHIAEEAKLPREDRLIRHSLQENLFRGWVDSLYFDVPFLGARFSASDAGVSGGLLLVVVSVWCFYSARRENHLIFYLVRDSDRYRFSKPMRRYLKNQLHATQLFAGTGETSALKAEELTAAQPHRRQRTMVVLSGAMYASAPLALAFLLFTDLYSLGMNSPFREGGKLYEVFYNPCFKPSLVGLEAANCGRFIDLIIRLTLSAGFLALCTLVMRRGHEFQKATHALMGHVDRRENAGAS
jgi:hypothetical protein